MRIWPRNCSWANLLLLNRCPRSAFHRLFVLATTNEATAPVGKPRPRAVYKAGWVLLPTLLLFTMLATTSFKLLARCYPKVRAVCAGQSGILKKCGGIDTTIHQWDGGIAQVAC